VTAASSAGVGADREHGLVMRHLVKHFGDVAAVDGVTLAIPHGTFLSLLGPSGCGKTTVLRLIGGFESPDSGVIEIGGADISGLPPYLRNIGMVFQSYALFPHMSVAKNVGFPLRQRAVPKEARNLRVEEVLDLVGLSGFGDRYPASLSGGQQQRVALARALIFNPRILVMDEPLAALDKRLRESMQREIRALQRRLKITTVYVTHDQTEAFVMSDLVAVMNRGKIEQLDTPRALYDAPRTEFVAQFVGDSNLFRGEAASSRERDGVIRLPDGSVVRFQPRLDPVDRVTLLVRPEKISMRRPGPAPSSGNVLAGRILESVFLGETHNYRVAAGGQEVIVRSQNQAGESIGRPGEDVVLAWAVADTVVL
jgi:putative spermidine/putrescine transport system ATP-binding protein